MGKTAKDYERDYTDPGLRARLKEELKASSRGGRAGEWSARKSQLLKQAYERAGGGYRHPERPTEGQRSLRRWTEEDWQTESGSGRARRGDTTERYLPRAAWEELSGAEREQTRERKREASRAGKQHVANPPAAKNARAAADLDTMTAREAARRARRFTPDEARRALEHERRNRNRKTVTASLEKAAAEASDR